MNFEEKINSLLSSVNSSQWVIVQKERKQLKVFIQPNIWSQHHLSSFTKLQPTQDVHLFYDSIIRQTEDRFFKGTCFPLFSFLIPIEATAKVFTSFPETRASQTHSHTWKSINTCSYHPDCVRLMVWRPKGHLDQPNSLGLLLPSSCLFSPQQTFSHGAVRCLSLLLDLPQCRGL